MIKTQLAENLHIYHLTGQSELNILTFVNNGKALIIDTGYPEQAKQLRTALEQDGLRAEIVINSHYHPDHINGNYVFALCKFMGSEHYKQNYELFEALNPNITFIKPTALIKDGQVFNYGSFELKFLNLSGHCRDLLAILINDQFLFVTDLLMFTNDGRHALPYVSYDGTIAEHLHSLDTIATMSGKTVIPSHGVILSDPAAIQHAIDIRKYYLTQLQKLGKNAKLQDCLCEPVEKYAQTSLHEGNLKNLFR